MSTPVEQFTAVGEIQELTTAQAAFLLGIGERTLALRREKNPIWRSAFYRVGEDWRTSVGLLKEVQSRLTEQGIDINRHRRIA